MNITLRTNKHAYVGIKTVVCGEVVEYVDTAPDIDIRKYVRGYSKMTSRPYYVFSLRRYYASLDDAVLAILKSRAEKSS